MALNKVEYSTYNSLWTRIGIFFDNHPLFGWVFWIGVILSGVIGLVVFIASIGHDKTKDIGKNKVVYNHVIAVKRNYGVTDTISYHDVDSTVHVRDSGTGHVFITVHGKNWLGVEVDNDFHIDEVKDYKIIK